MIIHDFVLDETKTHPQFAALFNLNMLIDTEEGASYSEQEYRAWLEGTGFKQMKKIDLESNLMFHLKKPEKAFLISFMSLFKRNW
ncbi:MAG: hypothetical protein DYG83_05530 [Candidatus Brocadia sp. AMX2]|nr:MAG: hypothetical protein EDM70_14010 [Candidatus Brocadia sp. AMX2]MBC6931575.1 hypothetical protein [Candidatus Brocadia sp.]MBL1169216.1 hypothetical protein [Candidatus Brocadia sp. AMX1]MCE7866282.1 hypothetical protein [Candidatus Brocadia sp. AMX2]MCQ3916751.1 hypothetical protein [Candidatus Brocadia sp.]